MNEDIQNQILLRSTGELPPVDAAKLERLLATDAEAADFARFVSLLPAASQAPRDFAGIAIHKAARGRWRMVSIAALSACIVVVTAWQLLQPKPNMDTPLAAVPLERITIGISRQLDAIESELASLNEARTRARFRRTPRI